MFKQKLKEKAYKSFDKLIVDPSFIKNTAPIKPAPRKNLFIPIFSASLAFTVIGAIALTTFLRTNANINSENARIREEENTYISPFAGKYGIYLSFWQITDMKNPDNQNGILHNYHAVHVVLGEVVEEGWLEFSNTEIKTVQTPVLNFRGQKVTDENGKTVFDKKEQRYNFATVHFADEPSQIFGRVNVHGVEASWLRGYLFCPNGAQHIGNGFFKIVRDGVAFRQDERHGAICVEFITPNAFFHFDWDLDD